jgi:predicted Zn-dependent peptidase
VSATTAAIAVTVVTGVAVDAAIADDGTRLRTTRLDSGLVVATEDVPTSRSVAVGVWVGAGSRDEPEAIAGVSHVLEHLLFRGTETRTGRDISRLVDRLGGDLNAFTSKEHTGYYCRVPSAHGDVAVELLGDIIGRPLLAAADLEAERQVVLEELAMNEDAPDETAHRRLCEELFPGHGLGRETAGDRSSVRRLAHRDLTAHFEDRYRTGSMVVSVAGPLDHAQVVDAVTSAFADVGTGGGDPPRSLPPAPATGIVIEEDDTEQVHLVLGWPALARTDGDREALDVLDHALGGGLSSRLFEEVRERRGLAYSVFSGTAAFSDTGMFSIAAATSPEHVQELLQVVRAEVDALVADGISPDELDIAVGYLTGSYELGLEDTGARMARTAGLLVAEGSVRTVAEQLHRWRSVSIADVARVIERVMAGPPVIVAVGPVEESVVTW